MRKLSLRAIKPAGVLILVAIGLLTGIFIGTKAFSKTHSQNPAPDNPDRYPLLSRRLFVENPNDTIISFAPLREDLKKYFADLGVDYSFYFEYLPSGISIKISQDKKLAAASMMKVPLVMNLYEAAEEKKVNLYSTITIEEKHLNSTSGNLWQDGLGRKLTLEEAARYTIVDSDNTALRLLVDATDQDFNIFKEVIDELGVDLTTVANDHTDISAQGYASILKCLYLSCLLNHENSEHLLELMTESKSPPRLKAGIPDSIKVAHKFGTKKDMSESDCGIVYKPKRPYLICIMLDLPTDPANTVIADVSRRVYEYVGAADNNR